MTPRLDILPPAQRGVWPHLGCVPRSFVLYGGTALALRLGHRQSEDFDFFSAEAFDATWLLRELESLSPTPVRVDRDTLEARTDHGVRLSFFGGLTFGQVAPPDEAGPARIASIDDLFATKLATVYQRSEAKDYTDIDAILQTGRSLAHGLGCARAVYGPNFNPAISLKALGYYEDVGGALPDGVRKRLLAAIGTVDDLPTVPRHADRIGE